MTVVDEGCRKPGQAPEPLVVVPEDPWGYKFEGDMANGSLSEPGILQ
jgi:hypothetical protein